MIPGLSCEMDILTEILRIMMLVSLGLNIWGFVLSMRTVKRARKSWERAKEVSDALAELHRKLLENSNEGEEQ